MSAPAGPEVQRFAELVRHWIVASLERWCNRLHFITHHRPWLWLPIPNGHCLLATWSFSLAERWHLPKGEPMDCESIGSDHEPWEDGKCLWCKRLIDGGES